MQSVFDHHARETHVQVAVLLSNRHKQLPAEARNGDEAEKKRNDRRRRRKMKKERKKERRRTRTSRWRRRRRLID